MTDLKPNYRIAGHLIRIESDTVHRSLAGAEDFAPFATADTDGPAFTLYPAEGPLPPLDRVLHASYEAATRIEFGTAGSGFAVTVVHDRGCRTQVAIDPDSASARVETDGDTYSLKMALWFVFGTLTVRQRTVAIHASTIVWNGRAVLFLGESGTGKSTHTRLWREHIEGAGLLNDDSPILRVRPDGSVWVYGSPWSGKTPCYKNEAYPVAGLVRLSQAPENRIRRLPVVQAFGALHPSCPPDFTYDDRLYDPLCDTLNGLLTGAPVYHLACLPDKAAARLSQTTVFGTETGNGNGTETNVTSEEPCGR